jgi:hypothetical protein
MSDDPRMVARFNGGMVDGAKLAQVLRDYPTATLQINDGWIDVYSDDLPRSHPLNVISDVVQEAWERGAITDARFNEASSCLEMLWDKASQL